MAAAGNMVHCQLWMGGLEPYMTESFILASFQRMGEKPLNVKVMRNKFTGEQAGYCFVHFENDEEAIDAMHKLNGKIIPNTNPSVRFRLNTATNQGKIMMNEREFSLWVGDLTPEVDDYTLYKTFAAKYTSIKAAKVILDASGYSKGFGFLRFGSEEEQKHCLIHMNGYKGLGMKPLKISNAIPKAQRAAAANGSSSASANSSSYNYTDYSQFYDPNSYWQNYSQWSGYGYDPNTGSYNYDPSAYAQQYSQYQQYNQAQYQQYSQQYSQYYQQQNAAAAVASVASAANVPPSAVPGSGGVPALASTSQSSVTGSVAQGQVTGGVGQGQAVSEESEIVEHTPPLDVDKENLELAEPLINFWTHTSPISNEFNVAMNNEYEKLNFIEVTIPPIKKKLENGHLAKKIVLSHACEMTFKDWEKRFEDKQKLSENDDGATWSSSSSGESEDEDHESDVEKEKKTKKKKNEDNEKDTAAKPSEEEGPRNEESSIADDQKMDVDNLPTKESGEPTVVEESVSPGKRKNDDESTEKTEIDSPSPKKMKLSENDETTPPMETTVPVEPPPQQDERPPVDRSRLFSVMADVDVNVLMADTESVSSKPTSESEEGGSDSSDGDSETEVEAKDEGKDDGEIVSEPAVTTKMEQTDETSREDSGHDQKQAEESNSSELIDGKDEAVS